MYVKIITCAHSKCLLLPALVSLLYLWRLWSDSSFLRPACTFAPAEHLGIWIYIQVVLRSDEQVDCLVT